MNAEHPGEWAKLWLLTFYAYHTLGKNAATLLVNGEFTLYIYGRN